MLKISDNIEIDKNEIFGLVGLVDSGRTTMLKEIYVKNREKINYVDKLPKFQFLKVKTILRKYKNHEYIKMLDLDLNKRISDLNYNETRKLLFLLSVFTNKDIIILDEPFLLVENDTKIKMFDIIKLIKKTFIISFDSVCEAKFICNKYAIIKHYRIVDVKTSKKDNLPLSIFIKAPHIDKALLPLKDMKIDCFSHDEIKFIYKGNINELLKYLVDIKIEFLEIKETDLKDLYKYCYKD